MKLTYDRPRPILFFREQLKSPYTRGGQLFHLIRHWLRGFSSEQASLLDVTDSSKLYLKDFLKYRITTNTNHHIWPILHDKLFFHLYMTGRLNVTPLLFIVINGGVQAVDKEYTRDLFVKDLQLGQSFVIKPLLGGGGKGLYFIEPRQQEFQINKKACSLDQIEDLLNALSYHGVYRHVQQHSKLAKIFPETTNTLRILSCTDKSGTPHIVAARLRIGSRKSYPTDNFQQGGFVGYIDPKTGSVTEVLSRNEDQGKQAQNLHPDSGTSMIGLSIPFWEEIKNKLHQFLQENPAFDLVGWDVLIGEHDFYFIEGNHNPGLFSIFMFEDLNQLPILKEFCRHKALI